MLSDICLASDSQTELLSLIYVIPVGRAASEPFGIHSHGWHGSKADFKVWSSSVSPETCVSALIWDSKADLFIPLKGYCMFFLPLSVVSWMTCNSIKNCVEQSSSWADRADESFWALVTKASTPTEESCQKSAWSLILFNLSFYRTKS